MHAGALSLSSCAVLVATAAMLSLSRASSLPPLHYFKECDICPEMVVVPAGEFVMGAPESEIGSTPRERPQHVVSIADSFAVGRFPVTLDQWDACVLDKGCTYRPPDGGWGRGSQPVLNILWEDAKEYVAWLSRITRKPYRLMSEAEREYVTRAGTQTAYWWGSSITPGKANYRPEGSPDTGNEHPPFRGIKPVPVHSFVPNPWGLYQVHGNVYEWVDDCWNENYIGAPTDGSSWSSGDCKGRVLRGGSFNSRPEALRAAARIWSGAPNRLLYISVRVARTLVQ